MVLFFLYQKTGGESMAKSKWETHVKDRLIEVEGWARDGLTDEQIAKNLGISIQTFYTYKEKYLEFFESLKKGKEVVNREVENALLKRALGYTYEEETIEELADGTIKTKTVTKHMAGDTTAQIFWLKNRKPDVWRDKTAVEHSGEIKTEVQTLTDEELNKQISQLRAKLGIKNE